MALYTRDQTPVSSRRHQMLSIILPADLRGRVPPMDNRSDVHTLTHTAAQTDTDLFLCLFSL